MLRYALQPVTRRGPTAAVSHIRRVAEPLYLVQAVVVLDGAMVAIALPKVQDGLSLSVVR